MSAPVKLIAEDFLTAEERNSPIWDSVVRHLTRMLEAKRLENDNPKLTDVETATLRGHIAALKAFIALGRVPPPLTAPLARPASRPDYGAKYG